VGAVAGVTSIWGQRDETKEGFPAKDGKMGGKKVVKEKRERGRLVWGEGNTKNNELRKR